MRMPRWHKRREQLAQHDRPRPQRAGQQHLVAHPLFLASDRARGKARRHERRQHVLPEEEQIHQPLGRLRLGQIEPLLLRPRQIHDAAQQRDVDKQQHKRPRHPQVGQKLALENWVFDEVHNDSYSVLST